MADLIEEWPRATERLELDDIEITDDGSLLEVTRVHYQRYTDRAGFCPFCQSKDGVEFVDEVGPGGTYRKQRFECECGAFGEGVWTWKAGLKDDPRSNGDSEEVATDGGHDPWCDWCQRAFGADGPDWKIETDVVTGWFCSKACADQWDRDDCYAPQRVTDSRVATDGGREMSEWVCDGCGDSFETPGEPELPCLKCGTDEWQEVDA